MAPPPSPEDLYSSEEDLPGPSTSQEKTWRGPHPSQEDQHRGPPPRGQREPSGTGRTQEDHPRSPPARPQHELPPRTPPQPEEGDVEAIGEADVEVLLQEEDADDEDEDEDDDDEDEVIITNSAKQLTEFTWISGNKFKERKSILVDGYNFHYRLHQHNEQKTAGWYR
jgi:hypothetical protein